VERARLNFCQKCGAHRNVTVIHVHHLVPRSRGGGDVPENLVSLCWECHRKHHDGTGPVDPERLLRAEPPPLEHVLQAFADAREQEDEGKWAQAAVVVALRFLYGLSVRKVSAETGLSPAAVRAYTDTYMAFWDESLRAKDLGFTHHRIAAKTSDPLFWIEKAAENGWSTRQMEEAVRAAQAAPKAEEELRMAKAERVLREAAEVLAAGGRPAEFLADGLRSLLFRAEGRARRPVAGERLRSVS
jgi:hypothetical protein